MDEGWPHGFVDPNSKKCRYASHLRIKIMVKIVVVHQKEIRPPALSPISSHAVKIRLERKAICLPRDGRGRNPKPEILGYIRWNRRKGLANHRVFKPYPIEIRDLRLREAGGMVMHRHERIPSVARDVNVLRPSKTWGW